MTLPHQKFRIQHRSLLKGLSLGIGSTVLGAPVFPFSATDKVREQAKSRKEEGKLGIALVGLGQYSATQLAPALQETEHCYLAGIVTGTASKIEPWKKKYDIPDKNVYDSLMEAINSTFKSFIFTF